MAVRTLVATEFAITRSFHTSTTVFIPYLMQQHPCRFWSYQCNQLGQWQHWATQDLWISNKNHEGHRKVWGSIRQRFHSSEFSLCSMLMIRFKKLFSISLPSQKCTFFLVQFTKHWNCWSQQYAGHVSYRNSWWVLLIIESKAQW